MDRKSQIQFLAQTDFSLLRRELDLKWSKFVIGGVEPEGVRPVILESWRRCRDLYKIDPNIKKMPAELGQEELLIRQEQNEVLPLARPFFDELTNVLIHTGNVISFYDDEGWLIELQGDRKLMEERAKGSLGFNFREQFAGTNGAGTALVERRPIQVLASEHYLESLHPWAVYSAPILDPISHEPLAVVNIGGYEQVGYPHTLLVVSTVARAIEQKIWQRQLVNDKQIIDDYLGLAAGRLSDGLLAVDRYGRILRINAAASRILCMPETTKTLDAYPHLSQVVLSCLDRPTLPTGPEEHQVYCSQMDRYLTMTSALVIRENRAIGVVAIISNPPARSGGTADRSSEELLTRRTKSKWARAKYTFEHILGNVAEVKQALKLARLAATNTLPVLITGESGTGKEMVAHSIHNASHRARMPFIVVNCGAIPEELIEAELFGYEAGAFTGAKRIGSAGKFESADGGTIFLDEVSELSPNAQVALLRVLQEMEVVRLGRHLPTVIDVRVIAATNRDLRKEVEARRFRDDLYYRLNVLSIELPPLRERREDISILAEAILQAVGMQLGQRRFTLSQEALVALLANDWPGNIRELKNVLERAAALAESPIIGGKDLPPELRGEGGERRLNRGEAVEVAIPVNQERELLLKILRECSGNISEASRQLGLSRRMLHRKMKKYSVERELLLEVLRECSGNISEASRQLGLARLTLYRKMKIYAISKLELYGSNASTG